MPREPSSGAPLAALLPSWELSLAEANKSPKTIVSYLGSGQRLIAYLRDHRMPDDTEGIDAPHLRAFLKSEMDRTSAVSVAVHYRNLRVLFSWLEREEERQVPNPMRRVDPPNAPRKVKPVLREAQLAALLKACEGVGFAFLGSAGVLDPDMYPAAAVIKLSARCDVATVGLGQRVADPAVEVARGSEAALAAGCAAPLAAHHVPVHGGLLVGRGGHVHVERVRVGGGTAGNAGGEVSFGGAVTCVVAGVGRRRERSANGKAQAHRYCAQGDGDPLYECVFVHHAHL